MPDFGNIALVEVRTMWPNEARDFTPWLASNLSRLGVVLGMDLELTKREADVGDFSLDLLARDLSTNRPVIIENQFGATNHDHFGKLITYAAGIDAAAVIWLAESIRDEHRQAIEWLNSPHPELQGATPFSLLKTEAGGRAVEGLLAALEFGFPV